MKHQFKIHIIDFYMYYELNKFSFEINITAFKIYTVISPLYSFRILARKLVF